MSPGKMKNNLVCVCARARAGVRADSLDNAGSSTSHNPIVLHGLLRG
jgi:hypothetical protein